MAWYGPRKGSVSPDWNLECFQAHYEQQDFLYHTFQRIKNEPANKPFLTLELAGMSNQIQKINDTFDREYERQKTLAYHALQADMEDMFVAGNWMMWETTPGPFVAIEHPLGFIYYKWCEN